jgi:hypothetical protein
MYIVFSSLKTTVIPLSELLTGAFDKVVEADRVAAAAEEGR